MTTSVDATRTAVVCVPASEDTLGVARGSAMVVNPSQWSAAARDGDTTVVVWFEANIYNAENLRDFGCQVYVATARMVDNAPTTAKATVRVRDLVAVGEWDDTVRYVTLYPDGEQRLAAWLGHPNAVLSCDASR
jgi:hypothetical protein